MVNDPLFQTECIPLLITAIIRDSKHQCFSGVKTLLVPSVPIQRCKLTLSSKKSNISPVILKGCQYAEPFRGKCTLLTLNIHVQIGHEFGLISFICSGTHAM